MGSVPYSISVIPCPVEILCLEGLWVTHVVCTFVTWDPITGIAQGLFVLCFALCSIPPCLDALPLVGPLLYPCVSCVGLCSLAHHISAVILGGIPGCHCDGIGTAADADTVSVMPFFLVILFPDVSLLECHRIQTS